MKAPIAYTRTIELRKNTRYRLSAPALFYWATQNGPPQSGEGTTRDIDKTGAYINAQQLPPVGALVQMDITLPNMAGHGPGVHLTGEGVVLRVEPHEAKVASALESGFAVSMQFYVEPSESVLSHLNGSGRVM